MQVEIKGKNLIVSIPISETVSGSGKSTVIASTRGNMKTGIMYKDKEVILGLNAYTPLK
jgi:hypothetical protein